MRKRNLILPLFLGSFFITSNVDSSVIDLYQNKNSNNDFLIAGGDCGGGGGGSSPAERKKKAAKQAKAKINTLKKILAKQEAAGEDTTRTKQLINLNQQLIDEEADGYYEDEKEVKRQKSKDAEIKRIIKSKIAAKEPLTDKEKILGTKQVINILKDLKNSVKNGNEAEMQAQLKELLYDYGLGDMTYDENGKPTGSWQGNNILGLVEMGDFGIDLLIKNFESKL